MKVVTTNLLNRFWKSGIKPIKDALTGKVDSSRIVNSLLTTEAGFALDARQGKALNDKITQLNGKIESVSSLKRAYVKKPIALEKGRNVLVSASELAGIGISSVSQIMSVHGRYGMEQFPFPALDVTNAAGDSTFRMSIVLDASLGAVVAVCAAAWTSRTACVVIDYID